MKFGKAYTEYIERESHSHLLGCSYVEFKRLKKVLKRCPLHLAQYHQTRAPVSTALISSTPLVDDGRALLSNGPHDEKTEADAVTTSHASQEVSLCCPGCDAKFFGELMEELAEVVGCFNSRAQELLQLHLASGFRKFLLHLKFSKLDQAAMIQQGRYLMSYAFLNATAVRKIIKKYDKVHQSNINGGASRRRLLAMRGELLQSPWFIELSALYLNLADSRAIPSSVNYGLGEFSCDFESDSPALSCTVLESARLEFVLNCSICLDTVFDPVALGCGHVFCNSCVCAAASVLAYEGPRSADINAKCPLCRKAGVYLNAVRLKELATLVHNRCNTYWTERLHKERKEQLKEAKMASEKILQAVMRL